MKLKKIVNSQELRVATLGSIIIKFSSAFFALLNAILLAKLLSVQDFGIYILALTTVTIATIPVSLGLPELLTRYISKYHLENNFSMLKGLLIKANQMVLISSTIAVFIAFLLYLIWWKNYSENTVQTFWFACILLPLLAFGELRAASLRGMKFVILGQIPDTFLRNLMLFFPLTVCYFFSIEISPQRAMLFHIFAALFSFLVGAWFLYKKLLKNLLHFTPKYDTNYWFRQAIPFTLITSVQVIKIRSMIYFLAAFWGVEVVAIYDVANRGASLVAFTVDALNKAVSPYISIFYENNNQKILQRIVKKTARLLFAFSLPVVLVFILGGKPLLYWLFGEEYGSSYFPLLILLVGYVYHAMAGPIIPLFNMTNNQKFLSKNQLYMMVFSLVLSIPFIYFWGAIGAAAVFTILSIIQNSILLFYIKSKLGIDSTIF